MKKNCIVIGGGLSGLITAIQLVKAGIPCILMEKKSYPLHKVCGEYVSNEALPFLKMNGLYPEELEPRKIGSFQLSAISGKHATIPLDLGGFGISRYAFDHYLFEKAKAIGVEVYLLTDVLSCDFVDQKFVVKTIDREFASDVVIGSFGKRSKLDVSLNREFIKNRSPFVGVKYHIRADHPADVVSLHNFEGGYCGVATVEQLKTNLCYLTHRDNLRKHKDIASMEKEVLYKNPLLKSIFQNSEFLMERPEVINEISFATKRPVENHILMVGDAAGMIAPACGNGMAMAIRSAKLAAETVLAFANSEISREQMEREYLTKWRRAFAGRLARGRAIQRLFGSAFLSNATVNLALHVRPVAEMLVRQSHGEVF